MYESYGQFHQHFMRDFLVQQFRVQHTFVLFWCKNIGEKATLKMLVKVHWLLTLLARKIVGEIGPEEWRVCC
jgi:hypothetical protein